MNESVEQLLSRLALALGIGLLIGLERGWRAREGTAGSRTAGVRTFAITGLLGGVVGALSGKVGGPVSAGGGIVLGLSLGAYALMITLFSRDQNREEKTFSATTAIAAVATFALGAYAVLGDMRVAAAAAVAAVSVLFVREELHEWVRKITPGEFRSGVALLAMTCIVLPIMPNRDVDALYGINLREIWIIAIALAGVSFAGYIAVRVFGEKWGVLAASAIGGLVSSTAVTVANARRAGAQEGSPQALAAGAVLATAISYIRVVALVLALRPSMGPLVAPPLVAGALVALSMAIVGSRSDRKTSALMKFRNPFAFWPVIGLALLIGLMILLGRWIYAEFGSAGAITGAAAMGLFDVDAMVVSMVRLGAQPQESSLIAFAILAGVASNTVSKAVIGAVLGRAQFAARVALASAACIVAGWLAMWVTLGIVGA